MDTIVSSHRKLHLRVTVLALGLLVVAVGVGYLYFNPDFFSDKSRELKTPVEYMKTPLIIEIPVRYELGINMGLEIKKIRDMKITCYTNREEETDSTPNKTATQRIIYEGSCAISRDLLGWLVNYGDIVYVEEIDKYFIVEDTMDIRWKRRLDVFMFKQHLEKAKRFFVSKTNIYVIKVTKKSTKVDRSGIKPKKTILSRLRKNKNGIERDKTVQKKLKLAGHYKGEIDGDMGKGTIRAIKIFQKKWGLQITGIVDSATWKKLEAIKK